MNQILAALLNAQPANAASSSSSTQAPDSSTSGTSSAAQFKSQFDQAVQTLSTQANANSNTQGSASTQGAAQATTAGSTVQTVALADSLQDSLKKKIDDLLAKGETVAEIVQQLAASLAASLAQQFGGNTTQIQNQLQTAFASALTLPVTTGPPPTSSDLASALAQRFRQVADIAAGVIGETGQSNRIFAGSNLDAATTAGVQPAPTTTTSSTAVPQVSAADSMADDAKALLASLTASQGDGKTVATNGAQNIGTNGDTLLGRILARAQQAQTPAPSSASQTPAPLTLETAPAQSSVLTAMALAQAAVALGTPAAPTTSAPDPTAAAVQRIVANVDTASSVTTETPLTTAAPAPLNPAVVAFLKSFSDALTTTSTAVNGKSIANDSDPGSLLSTDVSSSQAPTIGAFAPVQAAIQNDAVSTSGNQSSSSTSSDTSTDPYHVVDQLITGVFMNTSGDMSTVRLRLQPESLGDISVRLTVQGDSVSATVMAQTPQAHDAILAGQQQLTRALADAGLKLSSFTVDLAGGFASFQQQQQQQTSQNGSSSGRNGQLGGVDTTETDDNALPAASPVGPPVLTGVDWSALNYLA